MHTFFRSMKKGILRASATGGPRMNPRASKPPIESTPMPLECDAEGSGGFDILMAKRACPIYIPNDGYKRAKRAKRYF